MIFSRLLADLCARALTLYRQNNTMFGKHIICHFPAPIPLSASSDTYNKQPAELLWPNVCLKYFYFFCCSFIFSSFGIMQIELLLSKYVSIVLGFGARSFGLLSRIWDELVHIHIASVSLFSVSLSLFLSLFLSLSLSIAFDLIVLSHLWNLRLTKISKQSVEIKKKWRGKKATLVKRERQHQFCIVVLMKFSSIILRISQMI